MGREANVSFRADITDLRKELKKIPGVTDVEAKRMVTKLTRQLKKAERQSTKAWKAARKKGPKKYGQSVAGLKGIFTAVIGGVAVQQVGRLISKFADLNDQINQTAKEAREVGETVEEYQRVVGAIDLLSRGGVKGSEIVAKLRKNLIDAADGSASMTRALDKMGLSVENFTGLNSEDQLALMADGLQGVTDDTERTQIAMTLLGRQGAKLLPVFKNGADGLRKAGDEIERAGLVTNEAAAEAEKLADAGHLLGLTWMGVKSDLLAEVSPAIRETADNIREMLAQARESGEIRELGAALASLADSDLLGGIEALASKTTAVVKATEGLIDVYNILKFPVQLLPRMLYDLVTAGDSVVNSWHSLTGAFDGLNDGLWGIAPPSEYAVGQLDNVAASMGGVADETERANKAIDINPFFTLPAAVTGGVVPTPEPPPTRPRPGRGDTGPAGEFTGIVDQEHSNALRLLRIYEETEGRKTEIAWDGAGKRYRIREEEWDFEREFAKWREEQIEKERQMNAAAAVAQLGYVQDYASSAIAIQQGLTSAIVAGTEEGTEARRKAEAVAFVANKIAALANITVSTAAAVAKANEQPYPGNIAMMIAAAGVGTAQTAIVAAEQPTFHTGGEVVANLEAGEHVSSRQAVRNAGGHEALDQLERGNGGAVGGRVTVIQQVNNRTTFAAEYEAIRTGESPYSAQIAAIQPERRGLRNPFAEA